MKVEAAVVAVTGASSGIGAATARLAAALRTYAAWVEQADRRATETIAQVIPKPAPTPRVRGPYETIAADLRAKILSGELNPPGTTCPPSSSWPPSTQWPTALPIGRWPCCRPKA